MKNKISPLFVLLVLIGLSPVFASPASAPTVSEFAQRLEYLSGINENLARIMGRNFPYAYAYFFGRHDAMKEEAAQLRGEVVPAFEALAEIFELESAP